jgi:chaperonin cofactor prefoldin
MDVRQSELNESITRYENRVKVAELELKDYRKTLNILRSELLGHMQGKQGN